MDEGGLYCAKTLEVLGSSTAPEPLNKLAGLTIGWVTTFISLKGFVSGILGNFTAPELINPNVATGRYDEFCDWCRRNTEMVVRLEKPAEGDTPLHFDSECAQTPC